MGSWVQSVVQWAQCLSEAHPRRARVLFAFWWVVTYLALLLIVAFACMAVIPDKGIADIVSSLVSAFVMFALAYGRIHSMPWLTDVTERGAGLGRGVTVALVIGFGVVAWLVGELGSTAVYMATNDMSFSSYSVSVTTMETTGSIWSALSCVVFLVAVPLCEEHVFRGLVFGHFEHAMPVVWAMVLSSFVFALCHMTLTHLPVTFMLGMTSCMAYRLTGSLKASVCLHSAYNAVALFASVAFPTVLLTSWFLVPALACVAGAECLVVRRFGVMGRG